MQKIREEFYNMLSAYLSDSKISVDYSTDAAELQDMALKDHCFTFFCEISKRFNINIDKETECIFLQIISTNYKNLSIQDKVIKILSDNGIKCAVLKGSSVSVDYPNPMIRPLGDIDILVPSEDYEKSIRLFNKDADIDAINERHPFHYHFELNDICIEIHNTVASFKENELNIKNYMETALNDVQINNMEEDNK